MTDIQSLRPFATPRQVEFLDALAAHGSQRKAAVGLGVDRRNLQRGLDSLKRRAAAAGYSPDHDMTHPAPDGYRVEGASTFYVGGEVAGQWVKTKLDKARQYEIVSEAAAAMSESIKREKPIAQKRNDRCGNLLNCYVVTDFHLGMYAWHEETGSDWDTAIAEDVLVAWFQRAIASSPNAKVGVLAQLGDFLHHDGLDSVTPEHHNILDADSRYEKLVRVAVRALRRIVRMLLEKHEHVHLIMAEGNHDPASSVWLREMFAANYEDEPRITVDQSPDPYYVYEFGATSLFFHHGHKRKPEKVSDVFAAKYRDVFGRTRHSYAHLGHKHEAKLIETNLMLVEQHRTLASPDAYASRGGWMSGRGASVITYDKEHGEVGRVTIGPEMLRG